SVSKQSAIENFVCKYNIDLDQSYAYGDTSGDFTMLNLVKNPTAINPTKELLLKILDVEELKEKINIIVERKDVVYKLRPEHIEI
ncbi:MAG: HAD hydrolase family protein, partial [Clostridiaceae bacterium]|nr:HAD hydrolase family protein [Clostridiaceae bacterium]